MKSIFQYCKENAILLIVLFLFFVAKLFFLNTAFFWDTIAIVSTPANYLYENGLLLYFPKDAIVPHPFFPDVYMAFVWKVFGRSLLVSHISLLPILFLMIYQVFLICKRFIPKKYLPFVFVLLLADPTLITQSLLITPDLFLLFFALWSINNSFCNRKKSLSLSLFLLATVGERGMIISLALLVFHALKTWLENDKNIKRTIHDTGLLFLPSILFFIYIVVLRKAVFGYLFLDQSEEYSWSEHWKMIGLKSFLRNLLILVFRFVDFGRIFLWGVMLFLLVKYSPQQYDKKTRTFFLLFICLLIPMLFVTIPFENPFGHRYFALHYFVLAFLLSFLIIGNVKKIYIKPLFCFLTIGLLTGNLWVYPERISQGWDSTLLHYPYHGLRTEVIKYLDDHEIDPATVGVGFPMTGSFSLVDLGEDKRGFSNINFSQNEWVLYSHINNFEDCTIDSIMSQEFVKQFKKGAIYINLYKVREKK